MNKLISVGLIGISVAGSYAYIDWLHFNRPLTFTVYLDKNNNISADSEKVFSEVIKTTENKRYEYSVIGYDGNKNQDTALHKGLEKSIAVTKKLKEYSSLINPSSGGNNLIVRRNNIDNDEAYMNKFDRVIIKIKRG